MPENPYYKDWREVFGWTNLRPRNSTPGGRHDRKEQGKEVETTRRRSQDEYGGITAIGSRPKDVNKRVWQVHDIFAGSLDRKRVDKERLVSEHASEQEAQQAGRARGEAKNVPHIHRRDPGPYWKETGQEPPTPEQAN